ncbi:MAG: hypothetical protein B0W54_10240 [Cellvibrio sp. 79]|nr:MAG: hypothetical protein B0W54_10240 [Cellvibrio sp. 79]
MLRTAIQRKGYTNRTNKIKMCIYLQKRHIFHRISGFFAEGLTEKIKTACICSNYYKSKNNRKKGEEKEILQLINTEAGTSLMPLYG